MQQNYNGYLGHRNTVLFKAVELHRNKKNEWHKIKQKINIQSLFSTKYFVTANMLFLCNKAI